jgi:hypothetical protein
VKNEIKFSSDMKKGKLFNLSRSAFVRKEPGIETQLGKWKSDNSQKRSFLRYVVFL